MTGKEQEGKGEVRKLVMKKGRRRERRGEKGWDWGESTHLSFRLVSLFFVAGTFNALVPCQSPVCDSNSSQSLSFMEHCLG